jgi:hypothetical protein
MTMDPIDPNLRPNDPRDPYVRNPVPASEGMGWGVPLGIAAVVLIAGLFFFNMSGDRTSTVATNNEPSSVVRPAPTPNVTPPPATPPAKTQ